MSRLCVHVFNLCACVQFVCACVQLSIWAILVLGLTMGPGLENRPNRNRYRSLFVSSRHVEQVAG